MPLHVSRRRTGAIGVGVLGIALALPVMTAGTAHADGGERCDNASVEYSLDGGKTWTDKGRMDGTLVTRIQVRLDEKPKRGCEYAISLASYGTEGPTWPTTGKQKFLGWDTTELTRNEREATLDVTRFRPTCFGQVDLYGNGKKYDGVANPLPQYPKSGFDGTLITAWNGGDKCAPPTTTPPTTAPPTTKPPTTKPPVETTKPPTESTKPPTESTKPPTESTKPPTESTKPPVETTKPPVESTKPPVATTKPATTSSAPAVVEGETTTPPVGKPEVKPVTDIAPASLAETGSDNSGAIVIGASAAALLVAGAGTFMWTRRRNTNGGAAA